MSHPTPRMTVDIWSRGTQDCGNISEKFFQNSTVFIEKCEVYKCLIFLWLLRIWLVKNSREHVCSAMTVNNWSSGNIAEKSFKNSTGCLAVLGNIVQYFEYILFFTIKARQIFFYDILMCVKLQNNKY